jgi:hypothetical protein
MSIPDAPWIGKCREDYFGYKEDIVCCESCGREIERDETRRVDGDYYCYNCYDHYFGDEDEEEEYEEDDDASLD